MPDEIDSDSAENPSTEKPKKLSDIRLRLVFLSALTAAFVFFLCLYIFDRNPSKGLQLLTANILSLAVLVVICIQAYIYSRQRRHMEEQSGAMREQLKVAQDGLTETRNLIAQNERAIGIAEQNVQIAREAFYIGEAPYFGIASIIHEWGPTNVQAGTKHGARPKVWITFLNGGKTPAWYFSAAPKLVLGDIPETGESFSLNAVRSKHSEVGNAFYPSGKEKTIEYETEPILSGDAINAILTGKSRLFLIIGIRYRDRGGAQTSLVLSRVFDPTILKFCDYDAYGEAEEKKTN